MNPTKERTYVEHAVKRGAYQIRAREYPGEEPAIVLMHGFPDNLHLYDRLLPYLSDRRVVAFDFLGWGKSDKPESYPYTADNQSGDLNAVISHLELNNMVLVAHDASGPPAIDWALAHPNQVETLVLLNAYYCFMPTLRPPEAIFLYATPLLRNMARAVVKTFPSVDRRLFTWQVGRFIGDPDIRKEFVPFLYRQFQSARPAFFRLNEDLLPALWSRTQRIPALKSFDRPVRIIFGADDPYLNQSVGKKFHKWFPASELFLLPHARHYVQVDKPEKVAELIISTPTINNST